MTGAVLPMTAPKERLFERLALTEQNPNHKAVYNKMREEASAGRDRLNLSRGNLVEQCRLNPAIQPPYSWDNLSETARHREILNIYRSASPITKAYYDYGSYRSGPNEENWVVQWCLWHVFRYRDNRNKARSDGASTSSYHGGYVPGDPAVDKDGRTLLHDAARFGSEEARRAIITPIDKGADVKTVDKDGRTPLHDAARSGSEEAKWAIITLIDKGADIKAVDKDGRTPLHDVARSDSEEIIFRTLSTTAQDFDRSDGEFFWNGLDTYRKCDGNIGDCLTVLRTDLQGHCFVARSISEVLDEFYPAFGLEVLNWITKLCARSQLLEESNTSKNSCSTESCPPQAELCESPEEYTSTVVTDSISTDHTNFTSIQNTKVKDAAFARIRGNLQERKLSWAVSSSSKEFVLKVKAALRWTLSALQSRPLDADGLFTWAPVSSDIGLHKMRRFEPTRPESHCWTELFSYACIADCPSLHHWHHPTKEGLEIDFNLLLELAAVDREIVTEDGLLLFGFDTCLIPLEPPESRRWHFLLTRGRQITPVRVRRSFVGSRFQGEVGPEYRSGYVYVGWCTSPAVTIGTMDSDTASTDDISMSSGVYTVKKLEESVERASSNDVSLFARIGLLGSSTGVSSGKKSEKKFKQATVVTKCTRKENFEGVLGSARATPCILWDETTRRAWLVSAVSVLLFASLRYIKWKRFSFKRRQENGQFGPATIHYATQSLNTTTFSAESALRKNQILLVDKASEVSVNDEITFGAIMMQMWFEMEDADDVCLSDTTGNRYKKEQSLLGYDLNEAICGIRKHLRALPIEGSIKSWQALADAKPTQVIFCKNAGAVLKCISTAGSNICCLQECPKGALSCLFQDLRIFYGERWDFLLGSPTKLSNVRELPIGNDYEWIPRGYESLCGRSKGLCSRSLQSITLKEQHKKKLQKKASRKNGQVEIDDTSLAFQPRDVPTVVTFGST